MQALEAAKPKCISSRILQPSKCTAGNFLKNFERFATANCRKIVHKILYFGSYLDGHTHNWHRIYFADAANAEKTWVSLKLEINSVKKIQKHY